MHKKIYFLYMLQFRLCQKTCRYSPSVLAYHTKLRVRFDVHRDCYNQWILYIGTATTHGHYIIDGVLISSFFIFHMNVGRIQLHSLQIKIFVAPFIEKSDSVVA